MFRAGVGVKYQILQWLSATLRYDYPRIDSMGMIAQNRVRISSMPTFEYPVNVSFSRFCPQRTELSTEAAIFARRVRVSAVFVDGPQTLILQTPYGARRYDAGLICANECL